MPSPIVVFTAGMGVVALAIGAGFAAPYFLSASPKAPVQTVLINRLINRPDPPPPTVEKIERNKEAEVPAAVEPDPFPAATKSETTGSGSAWVTEPPKVAETPKAPAAPTIPFLAPVATTVDPPLATPSSQAVASEPVTAGMRPATVQPSVKIETPPVKTEVEKAAPVGREFRER